MIKVGDRVKFMNDVGGGVVTKVLSKSMVHVENEDGFEIPTLVSELVVVNDDPVSTGKPSVEQFAAQAKPEKQIPEVEPAKSDNVIIEGNDEPNFQLAFVPENSQNPLDGTIRLYLINDSNFSVLYHFSEFKSNEYSSKEAGELEPNTKLWLDSISQVDIAELPEYFFQLIYFKEKSNRLEQPLEASVKVNAVKFYKSGSFASNEFFTEKAMVIKLNQSAMEKAVEALSPKELKKAAREKEPARKVKPVVEKTDLLEVDLHIHELIDDTAGLSNKEMLELQMNHFREKMEEAIKKQVKKVVFIHGLGNGTLKQELRRELSYKYKKYNFQDASFQEYGYGATLVILRK
ncbi:Smr/MutS family protein [Sunxiuqinia elliptica]|uniref:Smr domain-containing protein n=1 Tax=Sunxiuqinia elliptica TaxID=655355 RepID=A0A1I2HC87_9BACT|nr:DUF2027 domain-containing protein [Sunxiuqinia elliptica]SFF27272.1 Smr domain-containing protein [Sunxiuqinia elliptica]